MDTTATTVLNRIANQLGGGGAVVIAKDFLDLANRDAVDQALRRLSLNGDLKRIGRGLYHRPRTNPRLGIPVPPDPDKVAHAVGRQTGDRVVPSSDVVANQMGLSTQIPAKLVYLTTGRTRNIQVGTQTYHFKRVSVKKLPDIDTAAGRALHALSAVGPNPDPSVLDTISSSLSPEQRQSLADQARYSVGWVADIARQIATTEYLKSVSIHG